MSHLHIPDGVLPVWLWLSGLIIALAGVALSLFMTRKTDLKKKVPLLGMMSAMMLVGMSLEIVSIAYHVNLSVITGIILGPWLAFVAAFIVNLLLSLVGHGGVTTVGLNTIVIGSEGVMGYILFSVFRKMAKPGISAAAATVVSLFLSTCLMLLIVYISNINFGLPSASEVRDILETHPAESLARALKIKSGFNFRFFAIAALGLGPVGWVIEALITGVAVRFISKVKPEIIHK